MKEIVNVELTVDRAFVVQTVEGGPVASKGKGTKLTANLEKSVADAIVAQTGATAKINSTSMWSGDRFNVTMKPLKCTPEAPSVEVSKSVDLTLDIDDGVELSATANKGSVKVVSADKKVTFTAPKDAGSATVTITASKKGASQTIKVEVTITAASAGGEG